MPTEALLESSLPDLKLLSKGKVRDIYETSDPSMLLFVATDRISAYDVILSNVMGLPFCLTPDLILFVLQGIPEKGKVLTDISSFWFQRLEHIISNHFITTNVDEMPEEVKKYKEQLEGRTMLVRKAEVIPLEAIVRGYITGSVTF